MCLGRGGGSLVAWRGAWSTRLEEGNRAAVPADSALPRDVASHCSQAYAIRAPITKELVAPAKQMRIVSALIKRMSPLDVLREAVEITKAISARARAKRARVAHPKPYALAGRTWWDSTISSLEKKNTHTHTVDLFMSVNWGLKGV